MEAMECRTCGHSIRENSITLCTNKDRLWGESPEPVISYQVCRLWMPKEIEG